MGRGPRYHHGALREALIAGAREILAERGHDQFSLNEVARRAGVSTAAPYRHFDSRDDLLAAVAAQGYVTLYERLAQAADEPATAGERLLRLGGAYVRFAHDHPDLFMTMFRRYPAAGPVTAGTVGEDAFDLLLSAVTDAQRGGTIIATSPAEPTARAIWATLHGLAVLSLLRQDDRFGMNGIPEELTSRALSALLGL
ncbi:TetR/AcrR family transcriptional regulator [Solihabitans fulvus]|uniref:TetR/AcrR family transcriptional regulator n=1 Tax=Solihabitans fulvus TaxID=1892852 RepID=UPI001CB765BE|nr:TetR/AcrR family transcriptional regulator [Solihabitans fulvus]